MTGYADTTAAGGTMSDRSAGSIHKPFPMSTLAARVREALDNGRGPRSDTPHG